MKRLLTSPKLCRCCGAAFVRGRSASGRLEGIEDWEVRKFCSHKCWASQNVGENHVAFLPGGSVRKDGYVRVARAGKRVYLHREIAGAIGEQEVHHLDENPTNNSPNNLIVEATHGEHVSKHHAERLRDLAASQRGVPLTDGHRKAISLGLQDFHKKKAKIL